MQINEEDKLQVDMDLDRSGVDELDLLICTSFTEAKHRAALGWELEILMPAS